MLRWTWRAQWHHKSQKQRRPVLVYECTRAYLVCPRDLPAPKFAKRLNSARTIHSVASNIHHKKARLSFPSHHIYSVYPAAYALGSAAAAAVVGLVLRLAWFTASDSASGGVCMYWQMRPGATRDRFKLANTKLESNIGPTLVQRLALCWIYPSALASSGKYTALHHTPTPKGAGKQFHPENQRRPTPFGFDTGARSW